MNCSTACAHVAVADDGVIVGGLTERLVPPAGMEAGVDLLEFSNVVDRALREIQPDHVVVLLPETWKASYRQHLPRSSMETIIRLAVARRDLPLDVLARATVRSRLGIPAKGSLDDHVGAAGPVVGRYWTAGRGLAALAALAVTV